MESKYFEKLSGVFVAISVFDKIIFTK